MVQESGMVVLLTAGVIVGPHPSLLLMDTTFSDFLNLKLFRVLILAILVVALTLAGLFILKIAKFVPIKKIRRLLQYLKDLLCKSTQHTITYIAPTYHHRHC